MPPQGIVWPCGRATGIPTGRGEGTEDLLGRVEFRRLRPGRPPGSNLCAERPIRIPGASRRNTGRAVHRSGRRSPGHPQGSMPTRAAAISSLREHRPDHPAHDAVRAVGADEASGLVLPAVRHDLHAVPVHADLLDRFSLHAGLRPASTACSREVLIELFPAHHDRDAVVLPDLDRMRARNGRGRRSIPAR